MNTSKNLGVLEKNNTLGVPFGGHATSKQLGIKENILNNMFICPPQDDISPGVQQNNLQTYSLKPINKTIYTNGQFDSKLSGINFSLPISMCKAIHVSIPNSA